MNHERMALHLAICFITIVALMTANGLTATTNVYAAHSKHSGNHTSSPSSNGMPTSSTPSSNISPSSSTSGSGASGSKDNVEPGAQVIQPHRQEVVVLQ